MKPSLMLSLLLVSAVLAFGSFSGAATGSAPQAEQETGRKQPDVLKLAPDAKLGVVTFSHTNHTTKKYNLAGTGPVRCVECHHTAQPEAEVAKRPPLKTAWPKDRTTSLTAENVSDTTTPAVVACRDCHARADAKPKVWPEIPKIKFEGGTAEVTLTNQQAFHRTCAGCHDEAMKTRTDIKAPKTQQCLMCHKKNAA